MIDSHCHLDHEPLFSNIKDIISRSKKAGVKKILTISTNFKSFENIKNIIQVDDIIFGHYIRFLNSIQFQIANDSELENTIGEKINDNTNVLATSSQAISPFCIQLCCRFKATGAV